MQKIAQGPRLSRTKRRNPSGCPLITYTCTGATTARTSTFRIISTRLTYTVCLYSYFPKTIYVTYPFTILLEVDNYIDDIVILGVDLTHK